MISAGAQLTILESVDSTNNYAMAKVRTEMAKHGDGFFAMQQVQGRGQRGKTWVTEPGANIILTLVMKPSSFQLAQQFQFSAAIAMAVYDFFSSYAGDETSIKWPNDIYWRDRKAGGILIENIVGSHELIVHRQDPGVLTPDSLLPTVSAWLWAIAGMGININQTIFPQDIRNAVSLKQITGKDWDVIELAKELGGYVQNRYEQLAAGKNMVEAYNARLFKKGEMVNFKKGSRIFEARVKEVDEQGRLTVITGMEELFSFGEIEWIL